MENLAAYLLRAPFSQERIKYILEEARVISDSKDGKDKKTYDAREWLAAVGSHVPHRGRQSIRYYGEYSNSTRGRRQEKGRRRSDSHRAGTGIPRFPK
jgi:hypothetical protein